MNIKNTTIKFPYEFDIEVVVELDSEYVAASEYKEFHLPDGPLISSDRTKVVTDQMEQDYEDFIEAVTSLLEDRYHMLVVIHDSYPDYSNYYNVLARDSDGNLLFKFRLKLRISTHKAKRSHGSQKHKKDETKVPEWNEVLNGKPMPEIYPKTIFVNSEQFETYEQAFMRIEDVVEHCLEVMTRHVKYKKS